MSIKNIHPLTKKFGEIREAEQKGNWKIALDLWREARQIDSVEGDYYDYIQTNINSTVMLIEAIEKGENLRKSMQDALKDLDNMDLENKKKYAWLLVGLSLGMITKEARVELEEWINKYPMLPRETILKWGSDFYETWVM